MLLKEPITERELVRIKHIAHGAYGWKLTDNRALDVCRLVRGLPVLHESWPPRQVMRHIAQDHLESWELVRPKNDD